MASDVPRLACLGTTWSFRMESTSHSPSQSQSAVALSKFIPQQYLVRLSHSSQKCIPRASVLFLYVAQSGTVKTLQLTLKPQPFSTHSFTPTSSLSVAINIYYLPHPTLNFFFFLEFLFQDRGGFFFLKYNLKLMKYFLR